MNALLRRISLSFDSKITFHEFAKIIHPVELKPYLKRIQNKSKPARAKELIEIHKTFEKNIETF